MNAPAASGRARWAGHRHLVRWRGVEIPSYTTMLYLGCVAGVLVGASVAHSYGLDRSRVALAMTVLLVPALAGARLWFVLEHWSLYRREPRRIWRRSEGGSALYGGLLLSLAASVPLLSLFEIPYWAFWDAASLTMLTGLIFTRMGCLMNGCCAGKPASGRLGLWLPDRDGIWERRIPTPLLEAGWAALVLAGAALLGGQRPFAGAVLIWALGAYGAGRLLLAPTRAKSGTGGWWANVAVSVMLVSAAVATLVVALA